MISTNLHKFYLIIPPGFESLGLEELKEKWDIFFFEYPFPRILKTVGGLELETHYSIGLSLNNILKIPNRILWRIDSFKCRDFPKLFNKIKKIPWKRYLWGNIPNIKSSAKKSRLFDSKRIEKTVTSAIATHFMANRPKSEIIKKGESLLPYTLYLRFEDDLCTLSLDTSGEKLHKRGHKTFSVAAPLRENLAAGLLFKLRSLSSSNLLVDPMCGSGTFLFESANFYRPMDRSFAYQSFPGHSSKALKSPPKMALFQKNMGFDLIDTAKKNLDAHPLELPVTFAKKDLFQDYNKVENCSVIVNPPYGRRIQRKREVSQLVERIKEIYRPDVLGLVIPQDNSLREVLSFENGGIKVGLYIFRS